MAKSPTGYTAPITGVFTELWISPNRTGSDIFQIFGVQSIPTLKTAVEDVTYTVLESDEERSTKGIRPFESLEIECLFYKEQATAIEALANSGEEVKWYVKLPDVMGTVYTWEGSIDISNSEITNDGMLMNTIKAGKSNELETLTALPATASTMSVTSVD